ncbi:hypothetical protein GF371_00210 [Candidatus Woesearchaeota archaeon]|nr:hypothetical protein [Candidatus Woesearchaeota archaeon]
MIIKLNPEVAELIGMHVGDGTLYKTKTSIVWELRGGLDEKEYYCNHVKKMLESLFKNVEFKPKFRSGGKQGCFGIQTSKKEISRFFINYGFLPGSKTHSVRIPDYIKKANREIQSAFIRGLFDTDGYLRFERINNNKDHTYPKIEFGSASILLRDDLLALLTELGYRPYKWGKKDYYKLCLAGVDNLEKFMNEITPRNVKHLNKHGFWKVHGHNNPIYAAVA